VRSGDTTVWLDCGNGSFARLQQHVRPEDLSAVVLTHEHPDHCVDIYGLHVLLRYGLGRQGFPVYAPSGLAERFGALVTDWGDTFDWREVDDGSDVAVGGVQLRFSRTDHPPPTYAVEARADGRRLVYTSDTGPEWSVDAFGPGADVVLSESTYLHRDRPAAIHLSAHQAGRAARAAEARRLVLTHLWPRIDPDEAAAEGSAAFGRPVTLAVPNLVIPV
jgi:ribonuclease BN (tRNA processing enzyme)